MCLSLHLPQNLTSSISLSKVPNSLKASHHMILQQCITHHSTGNLRYKAHISLGHTNYGGFTLTPNIIPAMRMLPPCIKIPKWDVSIENGELCPLNVPLDLIPCKTLCPIWEIRNSQVLCNLNGQWEPCHSGNISVLHKREQVSMLVIQFNRKVFK